MGPNRQAVAGWQADLVLWRGALRNRYRQLQPLSIGWTWVDTEAVRNVLRPGDRIQVAKELQAGALVTVASEIALPSLPFNALHAFGRTVPLRVKLFGDFIAREARAVEAM